MPVSPNYAGSVNNPIQPRDGGEEELVGWEEEES